MPLYTSAQATLASPALTGNPTAPTASAGDNDTSVATTAFVGTAIGASIIEEKTFDGTIGTYTFSSIPATFKHLELIFTGRSSQSATTTQIQIQINGLGTAIYDFQNHFANNATPGASEVLGGTLLQVGGIPAANATATHPGFMQALFHHYTQTTFYKTVQGFTRQINSTTTATSYHVAWNGGIRATNAISSITLSLASGNFISGSIGTVIGIR